MSENVESWALLKAAAAAAVVALRRQRRESWDQALDRQLGHRLVPNLSLLVVVVRTAVEIGTLRLQLDQLLALLRPATRLRLLGRIMRILASAKKTKRMMTAKDSLRKRRLLGLPHLPALAS